MISFTQPPVMSKSRLHQKEASTSRSIQQLIQNDPTFSLEQVSDISAEVDSDGHTLLHAAAFSGATQVVDEIFKRLGSDEEIRKFCNLITSVDKKTALVIACERNHLEIVKQLYDRTDRNVAGSLFSPLHVAAINGHTKIVEYLVKERDENVDSLQDVYGFTPLHLAAQYNQVEMVSYLIDELNANKNIPCTTEKMLPIHTAILNNNLEVLKALLHRHSKECETSHEKFYEMLINDHIHINPLLLAIANVQQEEKDAPSSSLEMVKFLVNDLKADYSLAGNNGLSALHLCAERGDCELIKFFVEEKHEKVNQVTDVTKDTPLYLAALNNHLAASKLLLELGADPSIQNWRGRTILSTLQELSSKNDQFNDIYNLILSKSTQ